MTFDAVFNGRTALNGRAAIRSIPCGMLAIAIALLAQSASFAQPATATPYHSYATKGCANFASCVVDGFTQLASGKTLAVSSVTCRFNLPKTVQFRRLVLGQVRPGASTYSGPDLTRPVKLGDGASSAYYSLSGPTFYPITAPNKPLVVIDLLAAATPFSVSCTVGGTVTP